MLTPRQARQGAALLSIIVSAAVTATAITPPVQAEETVAAREGDKDRGLGRTPSDAAGQAHGRPSMGFDPPVDAEAIAAQRQSLNQYLIRDRAATIELTTADRAISEGRWGDAISILQALLDSPSDVFIWEEGRAVPISARARTSDLIRRLPPTALAEYERRYGADARKLLNDFNRTANAQTQRTLLRRFEFTAAGAEAHLLTAQHALDCGEFVQAARAFERYYRHPLAALGSDGPTRLQAEAAAQLAAESGVRVELPEFNWNQLLRRGDQTRSAGAWRNELQSELRRIWTQADDRDRNWRVALGNAQSHRPTSATAPTLAPLWSAAHEESPPASTGGLQTVSFESAPTGSDLLASWHQTRRERRLPSAGANFALVHRGQVLVRDFSGITSRDLATGEIRWQFACVAGLRRQAAAIQSATKAPVAADAVAASQLFNELFAQNSVLGMLSSDGRRVYCVDLLPEAPPPTDEPGQAANRLVALDLDVAGTAESEPIWESSAERWFFLGPPLPIGEQLFVIAERDSLVSLLVLDAETGATCWHQPISLVDARIADDPQRARQACCPAQAGDLVVCPTQLGTVVGVSIRDGGLEWVYSYEEATGPSQPWRKTRAFDREFGSPEYPNLPLVVGGSVIVLAPQSGNVHCIDLQTGTLRWPPRDRGGAQYAAAATDDLVLLIGPRECTALRIADGSLAWQQTISPPAGRGLVAGDYFVLPTEEGRIVSLEIRSGRLVPDLLPRLPQRRSVAMRTGEGIVMTDMLAPDEPTPLTGNLLSCGPYIVACSPAGVSVYPQAGVVVFVLRDRCQILSLFAF
jgi:outer membrane protein assembly factor BamB